MLVFWLWQEIVLKMRTPFKKNLLGLLFYDPLADVCFLWPNTLLLCISLFCIFLLYRTDPQVEVHIRILLIAAASSFVGLLRGPPFLCAIIDVWLFVLVFPPHLKLCSCHLKKTTQRTSQHHRQESGGCAIIITTGKKSSSHLSGGCAIRAPLGVRA